MKKTFCIIMLAALLAVSGCAAGAGDILKSKVWNVDINQPGYEPSAVWSPPGVSHVMDWQGENLWVSMRARAGDAEKAWKDDETLEYMGIKFSLRVSTVSWDGTDGTFGTNYSRTLSWERDGYAYSFSAESGDSGTSLDIICPENALLAAQGNYSALKDLKLQSELWNARFNSGEKSVLFELFPPPFGEQMLSKYASAGFTPCKEEGIDLYKSRGERLPDEPNAVSIVWNTDAGVIHISGSVPYRERNNVPEDVWSFINAGLARSITEQLGAKILPLS